MKYTNKSVHIFFIHILQLYGIWRETIISIVPLASIQLFNVKFVYNLKWVTFKVSFEKGAYLIEYLIYKILRDGREDNPFQNKMCPKSFACVHLTYSLNLNHWNSHWLYHWKYINWWISALLWFHWGISERATWT